MKNKVEITTTNYKRLRDAYLILALQLIITIFVVKIIRDNPKFYFKIQNFIWIPIILSFILLFIISISNFSTLVKLGFFTLFSVCLGMISIAASKYLSDELIMSALKSTLVMFITFSVIGWICYKLNINLSKLQYIMLFGLVGLIIGLLFSSFLTKNNSSSNNLEKRRKYFRTLFIFGFILFSILIAMDTFIILKSKYKDPVNDALSLYLSFINLFNQIVGIRST